MKYFLVIVTLYYTSFHTSAQNAPFSGTRLKFGEVSLDEVQSKYYSKDSTAEAVYFYDYGETTFEMRTNDIYLRTLYHFRIKIFKKSAFSRGNVQFQYVRGNTKWPESVVSIKGFTYNEQDGKLVKEKLTKEMIFDEQESEGIYRMKFMLPNIKEGSVIEYSYVRETPLSVNHNPRTWFFQSDIPVMWSEYRITYPNFFIYQILKSGYNPFVINNQLQTSMTLGSLSSYATQMQMVMRHVPAFQSESFITTPRDYISKVEFELASIEIPNYVNENYSLDYPSLNKTLLEHESFGKQYEHTGFLSSVAKELKNTYKDTLSQVKAAYDFVRTTVKWNQENSLFSSNIKKALNLKQGDAADINLLLVALLRELGLDAHPIVLSTRDYGRIDTKLALLKRFNYVIASLIVNNKDLLLDATDDVVKMGTLPFRCLNHVGFLVKPDASRFVPLEPTEKHTDLIKADFKILESGELQGSLTKSHGGYSDWTTKKKITQEGKDAFLTGVRKNKPTWNVLKVETSNANDANTPFQATYELVLNDYVTSTGDLIYVKPMVSEAKDVNLFKAVERAFPVDFGHPMEESYTFTYEIPKNYTVIELPKPISVTLPDYAGRFIYSIDKTDHKVTISSVISLRKAVYLANDYSSLRELFDRIIAKHSEQIVLKKN